MFFVEPKNRFDDSLLYQPNATIFSQQNLGIISPSVNGFSLYELTKPTDDYQAGSELNAGYIMLDNKYKDFRLVWGARFENFVQTLTVYSKQKILNKWIVERTLRLLKSDFEQD